MKPLPFREVKRRLEAAGFVQVSQKGSHAKFVKGARTVIVPSHHEVTAGVLRSVLRQASLREDEFESLRK